MLRLLTRFFGLLFLAGGFAALIVDGTRSLASGELALTPLGANAFAFLPAKLHALQAAFVERFPSLSDALAVAFSFAPLSVALTGLGAFLILLSQKHRRPVDWASGR